MDPQFAGSREDLYHVQMDVKHVQAVQNNHAERLSRLEKRQADDAALKSVWGPESPFPSVLSGTPQQGPVQTHPTDVFDDFDDEHSQNLLGSLQLEADEEPVRRGASRANSVRFDVSAIQGPNWTQGSRSSGELVPTRPTSGFGNHPMERSLSHKSDGRHSSAGHSVHSVHSLHSGRTSSLGLDTNFMIDQNEDSPVIAPNPPPGLFVLGSVPSIIRCWLTTNFSHNALLYAVVCTGSQKSMIDASLLKELDLADQARKDKSGQFTIRLPVYLPEAIVTQASSRSNSPAPQIPAFTAEFGVKESIQRLPPRTKQISVYLGSDTLRAHNGDVLFSQNVLNLYGDDHNKLSVPFVRPEDENLFKNLRTTNKAVEKDTVKATATSLTLSGRGSKQEANPAAHATPLTENQCHDLKGTELSVPTSLSNGPDSPYNPASSSGVNSPRKAAGPMPVTSDVHLHKQTSDEDPSQELSTSEGAGPQESNRRESSGVAWGSWRHGFMSSRDGGREHEPTSGYQKASRAGKTMKVLKPSKPVGSITSGSRPLSTVRTGAAYEQPPAQRSSGESSRKSQSNGGSENLPLRWEPKQVNSEEQKNPLKGITTISRSSNPVGGASAFAWMNPKPKPSATTAE